MSGLAADQGTPAVAALRSGGKPGKASPIRGRGRTAKRMRGREPGKTVAVWSSMSQRAWAARVRCGELSSTGLPPSSTQPYSQTAEAAEIEVPIHRRPDKHIRIDAAGHARASPRSRGWAHSRPNWSSLLMSARLRPWGCGPRCGPGLRTSPAAGRCAPMLAT